MAFIGHVPGLKLTSSCRFTSNLVRVNIVAVALTLAAMATAFAVANDGNRLWSLFLAWLIGHFIWSTIFASWIVLGGAVQPQAPHVRR